MSNFASNKLSGTINIVYGSLCVQGWDVFGTSDLTLTENSSQIAQISLLESKKDMTYSCCKFVHAVSPCQGSKTVLITCLHFLKVGMKKEGKTKNQWNQKRQ